MKQDLENQQKKHLVARPKVWPEDKENIWNIPNALTFSRIIITFLVVYFIFADFHIFYIIIAFLIGMFTDVLDGFAARKFKMTTEFGGKFDMVADRFIITTVMLVFIIKFSATGLLTKSHIFQIFFIISRDIITITIAIILLSIKEKVFPKVRFIGKLTTFMQTLTFPLILLSILYPFFNFILFLAVITGAIGLISSCYYVYDVRNMMLRVRDTNQNQVPLK